MDLEIGLQQQPQPLGKLVAHRTLTNKDSIVAACVETKNLPRMFGERQCGVIKTLFLVTDQAHFKLADNPFDELTDSNVVVVEIVGGERDGEPIAFFLNDEGDLRADLAFTTEEWRTLELEQTKMLLGK